MSTFPPTVQRQSADAPITSAPIAAGRARVVAVLLALASATVAAVLLWQPWPEGGAFDYDEVAPAREAILTGALLDAVAFAVTAVTLGVAGCLLAPVRGATWATAGAVVTGVGGIAFGTALGASGVLAWYATEPEALPRASGAALLRYVEDDVDAFATTGVTGFLMFNLGCLLVATALWRARTVHRAVPIVLAVLTVAQFLLPSGRAVDVVQAVQALVIGTIAWSLWRQLRRTHR